MIIGTLREAFRYRDPTPTYLISLAPQSSLQLAFKTVFAPPRLLVVTVDAVKDPERVPEPKANKGKVEDEAAAR